MRAHAQDLRAEVERAGQDERDQEALGRRAHAFAEDIAAQGSEAAPEPRLRALLQFAERLALEPAGMGPEHVQALREVGYDDRAIHDAVQVASYFAYINRVADGLGVDLEPDM